MNPYFTDDGIGSAYDVYYRETNAEESNLTAFETKEYGASFGLSVPVSEHNTVAGSLGYANTEISTQTISSIQITDFITKNGNQYDILKFSMNFAYDTRNKAILPDKGVYQRINGTISMPSFGDSLEYYKINYEGKWFKDLYNEDFILALGGKFGYGDGYGSSDELPFFENFYAGGPRTLRGYEENTLGPRDSTNRALGGDTRILVNAEVILPVPFLTAYSASKAALGIMIIFRCG